MSIETLIATYQAAKHAEDALKAKRQELARQIAAALEHPDEGSKTHEVGCYKVTVQGKINRKVDWEAFDAVTKDTEAHAPYRVERSLDTKGIKWLMANDPNTWDEYARTITSTPGQPQIRVKEIEDA